MTAALTLKPCPFCSGDDLTLTVNRHGWKIVECDNCGMRGPCIDLEGDEYLNRWNTRAASQPDRSSINQAMKENLVAGLDATGTPIISGFNSAANAILSLLSGAGTKSAPCFKASHNSGERDPSVMPDCRGADTKSDGGERSYCRGCGNQSYDNKFGCSICDMDAERPSDPSPGSDVSLSAPVGEPGQSFVLRPISTAPRDGTPFIAIATTKGWRATKIARFLHAEDRLPIPDGGGMWPSPPTHWTQLPVITLIPESDESPSCADSGDLIAPPAKIPCSSDPSPGPDVREALAPFLEAVQVCVYYEDERGFRHPKYLNEDQLSALTRPLGGSAQGSIATKQSSSSTPATATETSIDALEPWRDELAEIVGHLGAAIIQSTTSDDQIIMDHVKAAHEIAKIVRRKA